jgi:hypothetical protein
MTFALQQIHGTWILHNRTASRPVGPRCLQGAPQPTLPGHVAQYRDWHESWEDMRANQPGREEQVQC